MFDNSDNLVSFVVCEKEYDSPEFETVMSWLKQRGFKSTNESCHLVGSQELIQYQVSNGIQCACLIFETYEGVTLYTDKEHETYFSELKTHT
ncbi:hypothetical protein VINI7043_21096 [Vibrio nigripulchritudo ATCC 27043]|nr:hypothetical protein VINI7043_21096 [Vibrio nigripulchritudo ATCC 27043]